MNEWLGCHYALFLLSQSTEQHQTKVKMSAIGQLCLLCCSLNKWQLLLRLSNLQEKQTFLSFEGDKIDLCYNKDVTHQTQKRLTYFGYIFTCRDTEVPLTAASGFLSQKHVDSAQGLLIYLRHYF